MQVSLIKFLLLISFVITLQSCAPKHLLPLKNGERAVLTEKNFKPTFKDNFKSMVFKTNLSYGDKFDFGGMLAFKQLSEGTYRAIFMAMSGSKIFDFEFGKNGFVVHSIIETFNRKILLKVIEQDFNLLLANNIIGNKSTIFGKGNKIHPKTVIKTKGNQYYVQGRHNRLTEIHKGRKVSIDISQYLVKSPKSIKIQHHNFPLTLKLKLIKG